MFEFIWEKQCNHDKITPNMIAGYCPDCGEYVQNHWYITRCKCCGLKQKSIVKNGKILAGAKFCKNCGNETFITEELDCLDIINVNYAVVRKETRKIKRTSTIQAWFEENAYTPMKLLPSF